MEVVKKKIRRMLQGGPTTFREACPLLRSRCFLSPRPIVAFALIMYSLGGVFHVNAIAQQNQYTRREREIVGKVEPIYPAVAHRVRLQGGVRLQVKVAADGRVTSIQVLGGNPILVNAAVEAVGKWRWAKASDNTEELVHLTLENP